MIRCLRSRAQRRLAAAVIQALEQEWDGMRPAGIGE